MSDKSIFDKLQVKTGRTLLVINPPDLFFEKAGPLPDGVQIQPDPYKADVIIKFVRTMQEFLASMPAFESAWHSGCIIWLVYPKLTSKLKTDLSRDSIWAAAQKIGWTGVAMVSIDEDWSAFRLKRL